MLAGGGYFAYMKYVVKPVIPPAMPFTVPSSATERESAEKRNRAMIEMQRRKEEETKRREEILLRRREEKEKKRSRFFDIFAPEKKGPAKVAGVKIRKPAVEKPVVIRGVEVPIKPAGSPTKEEFEKLAKLTERRKTTEKELELGEEKEDLFAKLSELKKKVGKLKKAKK